MNWIIIFLLVIISFSFKANAEIIETHEMSIVKSKIAELYLGDMVLFDVNGIIFTADDQVMSPMHKSTFKDKFAQIQNQLGNTEEKRLKSIVYASYKHVLVDLEIPRIIKEAQKAHIIVLGLTTGRTNEYGVIKNRADLRIKTLKGFGIDFSKSINLPPIELSLDNDANTEENGFAIFKNGIIFAAGLPKGDILERFLKATKLKPKKIIFIDNKLKNINIVAEKCNEFDIEYLGIYFTKLSKHHHTHLDNSLVDKKFEILQEKNKWISDQEAKALLKWTTSFNLTKFNC